MISYLKYSHISCFATVFYLSKFEYGHIGAMIFTLSLIKYVTFKVEICSNHWCNGYKSAKNYLTYACRLDIFLET